MKQTSQPIAWCRVRCDLLDQKHWPLVASTALTSLDRVEAFVARVVLHAGAAGGSLDGFNMAALATKWRCSQSELNRIYAALERPDVAAIATSAVPGKSIRELVPIDGPLVARRPVVPAELCGDVTGELMGDPDPKEQKWRR